MPPKICLYGTGVVSVLLLIVSIALVLFHVFPNFLHSTMKKEIVLKNGTDVFEAWVNPSPPVYMQFYFFNVSNPSEVLKGENPSVTEVGPYTYREIRPMEQVTFLDNGNEISAVNPKTYIFEPNMSRGLEDDLIRTVNIPAVTVMEKFKDHSTISKLISAYMTSKNEGLFVTRKVGDLLWGYTDDVLNFLHTFSPEVDPNFGLFYKMNGTDDGEYIFFTGKQNYTDFTRVAKWRNESNLEWWSTDQCNMINGTNAASFHPIISKDEMLYMFSSDLCRSIYALFEKELYVMDIPAYRFTIPREVFANITENPANAGFCVPAGNCLGSGLLNVSVCKQGAPIIMSSPHFYQADKKYVDDIFGMNPVKEDHETVIDVNPLTGFLLRAAKRIQVNVFVRKYSAFSQTGNVNDLVFPVMYLNESIIIDEGSARTVREVVTKGAIVINIPFFIMGLAILIGVIFIILVCKQRGPESTPAEQEPLLKS
ncbi:lysosome membrane protein 2c [Paramormyrops kingsleyae]|uniref:Scavenger receptor class B member 2 n=1 Tax=Paramormyrops kingsleyae TaxID=1676925 RepID=A0A3B3S2M3_9TELE|nr:lysosome membrane protein 2 [Paramormyrops kingsleyae]